MSEEIEIKLSPTRPYITRALYEWIEDNHLTPYLQVDATFNNVIVPMEHVQDGQIVLNISSSATHQLIMSNDAIQFSARFGGVSRNLYIPFQAVIAITTKENGPVMIFNPDEYSIYTETELEAFSNNAPTKSFNVEKSSSDEEPDDEKIEMEKKARLEKAKKSGFRVLE